MFVSNTQVRKLLLRIHYEFLSSGILTDSQPLPIGVPMIRPLAQVGYN